jgi:hypothetical protein
MQACVQLVALAWDDRDVDGVWCLQKRAVNAKFAETVKKLTGGWGVRATWGEQVVCADTYLYACGRA